jgi:ABC-type glycerol-3-phosphate transport system permease component
MIMTAQIKPAPGVRSETRERQHERTAMILVTATAIVLMLPVAWLLISSFKTDSELLSYPIQIFPSNWSLDNYEEALTIVDFGRFTVNSAILATMSATLTVAISSLVGFGFARLHGPGRGGLFSIVVALLMVPNIVYVIPQFMIFSRLSLVGTWWPWVLWGLAGSPFHIFLFRQFFMNFPKDLEDAAEVDGCGIFRIYWQIFLPNARPVMAVSFILTFAWQWGDWFTPLIYLTDENTTLAVKLARSYADPMGNPLITTAFAASILYTLPLIVMFFVGQKQILQGVVTTGLKG